MKTENDLAGFTFEDFLYLVRAGWSPWWLPDNPTSGEPAGLRWESPDKRWTSMKTADALAWQRESEHVRSELKRVSGV